MSKKDDIQKIYREVFSDDSAEYVKMLFDAVYNDSDAMLINSADGTPASIMLLRRFKMSFHSSILPVAYIHGAATRRSQRGKGLMSHLVCDALRQAAARGDMMVTLIPANTALFYFYAQYGFSPIFYIKEQRFTSLHSFLDSNGDVAAFTTAETDSDHQWEAFNRFQLSRPCYVLHSHDNFRTIVEDNRIDEGNYVVMTRDDEDLGPQIVSMAWAVKRDDLLVIKDVMGESHEARIAALRHLRELNPDTPFLLYAPATDDAGGRLMPRGMGRIVDVMSCLSAVAAAHHELSLKIKVTDDILPAANSHIYIIKNGRVEIDDFYRGKLDFDVSVEVLASLVFNSAATGSMIDFPSVRPMISLMLD